jgi:hypothetical protein
VHVKTNAEGIQHLVEPYCKARAWEQCEDILLPDILGRLTHVRARALGMVSKGWGMCAAHATIIQTEMDDGKFVSSLLKYAVNDWNHWGL